jgi:predicted transcriptional regulator
MKNKLYAFLTVMLLTIICIISARLYDGDYQIDFINLIAIMYALDKIEKELTKADKRKKEIEALKQIKERWGVK